MNRYSRFGLLIAVSVFSFAWGLHAWSAKVASASAAPRYLVAPRTADEIALDRAEQALAEQIRRGGKFYKPLNLLVDYPGVTQTALVDASVSDLPASSPVVGIEVDGEYCAFVVDSMLAPETHIVNLVFNRKPVSVTYCDLVDCVRVLTDDRDSHIPLRVGGLDIDNQMVFLLDGERYGQSSNDLPLADHHFDRMELGEWQRRHPQSKIYMAPSVAQEDS